MTQIITNAGGVGDHPHGPFQREAEATPSPGESAPASAPTADPADVRLIIEDDQAAGGFLYTTIDRRTGSVLRKLPRDGLLKLAEASDYAAGALIKASA
jgi:hypothetical protein